nr:TPA_asm: ATP synthase F0 subunit 8 [Melanodrymia aurantiaca]
MPHLAPINWLIIWSLIWITFFIFTISLWWMLNSYNYYFYMLLTSDKAAHMREVLFPAIWK